MLETDISVILPVYCNSCFLEELHRRIRRVLKELGLTYHFIFVNDASPDRSRDVLAEIARKDSCVTVIDLPVNQGQQQATMVGLMQSRSNYTVVMDADLQDPPEAIPSLLQTLKSGHYDAVFAGRRGHYESWLRLVTSKIFKWLISRLTHVPRDSGSYVAMTQRMTSILLAYPENDPYMVGMIGCSGLPVTSIPVQRSGRPSGKSCYSSMMRLKIGFRAVIKILMTWRKR